MITKSKTEIFTASDGTEHRTLAGAQISDLAAVLGVLPRDCTAEQAAQHVLDRASVLLVILRASGRKSRAKTVKPAKTARVKATGVPQ